MELSFNDQFFINGFAVVPAAAGPDPCGAALRDINAGLAIGKCLGDTAFTRSAAVCDVFNRSPALVAAVEALLGPGKKFHFTHAQIALRFPGALCLPGTFAPVPQWTRAWHIDGIDDPKSKNATGSIRNFTLLVGVCLSDCTRDFMGNLVVHNCVRVPNSWLLPLR